MALSIFMAGDVMTGRGVDQILAHPGDPAIFEPYIRSAVGYVRLAEEVSGPLPRGVDDAYVWGEALEVFEERLPDFRVVNLETAITDRGAPWPHKGIQYRMHPANAGVLASAGIDCCSLANNHVLDWSYPGLDDTLSAVAAASARPVGAGNSRQEAERPVQLETAGRRLVVAAVGALSSGVPSRWAAQEDRAGVALVRTLSVDEADAVAGRVVAAADPGDVTMVSIHWGGNWSHGISDSERRFAHRLIDAGIDVVHGHSSHHAKAAEVYRDRLILYGCGDLLTDYEGIRGHEAFRGDLGLLYFASVARDGSLEGLEMVPTTVRRFRIRRAGGDDAEWLQHTLTRHGAHLGSCVERSPEGHLILRW